jgi:uncharacterized damage-inducible protein DinB
MLYRKLAISQREYHISRAFSFAYRLTGTEQTSQILIFCLSAAILTCIPGGSMSELSSVVASTLASYYEEVQAKVHEWIAPLSSDQLWRKPYPYGNSVGHILLHLTGNLNYYIGARIAASGYLRDRDREFNDTVKRPKEEILADFDRAIAMVVSTIRKQAPSDWTAPYSAEREPHSKDRFTALFRCAAHAYHHVGQIIYLSKELTKAAS